MQNRGMTLIHVFLCQCLFRHAFVTVCLLLDLESFIQTHNSYKCVMTIKLDSMRDGLQEGITLGLEKCAVVLPCMSSLFYAWFITSVLFVSFSFRSLRTLKLQAIWKNISASAKRKNERSDRGFIAGSPKPVCRLSFRGARNGFNLPGKSGCHVVQNNSTYEDVILFREITS